MKGWIYILFFILAQGTSWAQGVVYQEGTIDLTGNVNLKMVFDGGLRPTQTPGLETMSCQIENAKVNIIFPGNRVINILVEDGNFDVDADENLTAIDFYGPFQPLNDAINQAEAICQVLSLNPGNLETLRANPGSWENPEHSGWGGTFDTEEHRTQFVLRRQARFQEVGADIIFDYRWHHPSKLVKMRTTPIEPPAGYENFSMKPPPWHPTGPAYPPLSFDQAVAVGKKALEKIEGGKTQTPVPTTPPVSPPAPPTTETGIPFWVYAIIVLSIAVLVGAWFSQNRKDR
jgi:hypothetical protein